MRVLSITHGPSVPGGVFDQVVEAAGHELERWVVPVGGSPRPPSSYDAVMVFGGSMHPDQDERFAWLERETEFLRATLEEEIPLIGVCLGAQMLARAAGANVRPASAPEVGWYPVQLTPAGREDAVLGTLPERVDAFQWHYYTFDLPAGSAELATSEICTQAFRLGNAWGLQFHAEVTAAMVEAWAREEDGELPVTPEEFVAEAHSRIAHWNEHGRRIAASFLDVAAQS